MSNLVVDLDEFDMLQFEIKELSNSNGSSVVPSQKKGGDENRSKNSLCAGSLSMDSHKSSFSLTSSALRSLNESNSD
jgi:hypothetical protein